jgi:hypothetical protein
MEDITMAIDYDRMKRVYPQQKAALTRAIKKGYPAVLAACKAAVEEWNQIGAWPDAWSMWNRALNDAACKHQRLTGTVPAIMFLDQI